MYSVKFEKAELVCENWYDMKKYLETLKPDIFHRQILFKKDDLTDVIALLKAHGSLTYSFYTMKNNELWWLTNDSSGNLELVKVNAMLTNPVVLTIKREDVLGVVTPSELRVPQEEIGAIDTASALVYNSVIEDKNEKITNKTRKGKKKPI